MNTFTPHAGPLMSRAFGAIALRVDGLRPDEQWLVRRLGAVDARGFVRWPSRVVAKSYSHTEPKKVPARVEPPESYAGEMDTLVALARAFGEQPAAYAQRVYGSLDAALDALRAGRHDREDEAAVRAAEDAVAAAMGRTQQRVLAEYRAKHGGTA